MADRFTIQVDGRPVKVTIGSTVAAAIHQSGNSGYRRSVGGELRAPLCGMGICGECRVAVNGRRHERSCQTLCRPGMEVRTDE